VFPNHHQTGGTGESRCSRKTTGNHNRPKFSLSLCCNMAYVLARKTAHLPTPHILLVSRLLFGTKSRSSLSRCHFEKKKTDMEYSHTTNPTWTPRSLTCITPKSRTVKVLAKDRIKVCRAGYIETLPTTHFLPPLRERDLNVPGNFGSPFGLHLTGEPFLLLSFLFSFFIPPI